MDVYKNNSVNVVDMIRNGILFVIMITLVAIGGNIKRAATAIEEGNDRTMQVMLRMVADDMKKPCKCKNKVTKRKRKR
jgi:hypothetical protein